jgi:peptide/nickel transport system permease protein
LGLSKYVARRLLLIIPVFFAVTFMTFVISHVVVPNPVLAWGGEKSSPATIAAIAAQYHLNDPLPAQYYYYMVGLLSGDWGTSPVTHLPVLSQVETYFPATVELSVAALVLSILFGIPIGVFSALWNGKKKDYSLRFLYLTGIASPPFLLALLLQLVFSYYFRLLPSAGRLSPGLLPPTHIRNVYHRQPADGQLVGPPELPCAPDTPRNHPCPFHLRDHS